METIKTIKKINETELDFQKIKISKTLANLRKIKRHKKEMKKEKLQLILQKYIGS